jgi:hypothetical protein
MNTAAHWDSVFKKKAADEVSWYRPHLDLSLELIQRWAPNRSTRIVDVGAGESTLVDDLLACGYQDVTIMDIQERRLMGRARGSVPRARTFAGLLAMLQQFSSHPKLLTSGTIALSFTS